MPFPYRPPKPDDVFAEPLPVALLYPVLLRPVEALANGPVEVALSTPVEAGSAAQLIEGAPDVAALPILEASAA